MPRTAVFSLFFFAVFLQAGAYGLTFMLPDLFATFGADEKDVGAMLFVTAVVTLVSVYFSGHLSDRVGRLAALGLGCLLIAVALVLFGLSHAVGPMLVLASGLLGAGWALTYALAPVVMIRLVGPQDRVRHFALLSACVMTGFGLAPVLSAGMLTMGFGIHAPFLLTAALAVISGVIFFILIAPVRTQSLGAGPEVRTRLTGGTILRILRSRAALPITMVFLGASVFAGMTNFQTVFAAERGVNYAHYFLVYTVVVVAFRMVLAGFSGGRNPYLTIGVLLLVMTSSVIVFIFMGSSPVLYILVAVLFGLGYGVAYPVLVAMAANDAEPDLMAQTLQLFALIYFVGIFGFPLIAGWFIVEVGTTPLLWLVAGLAVAETGMALHRALRIRRAAA